MHSMRRPPTCGQSVRRHIRTASEGIWVTDTVLARAFERYCAASPAARRHVSFAPGPLESRRRLGRRHMTEFYSFQAHASLPPWALEMPANLGKWSWHPPTLRNSPINGYGIEQADENSSRHWLPNLLDPLPPNVDTSALADAEADGFSPAEDDVERDMQWLMEQIRSKESTDIQPSMDIFIDSMKAHAKNGNLVPGHVHQIATTLPALLAANHRDKGPPAGLASLLDAICKATGLMKATGQFHFDSSFSNVFLSQLLLLEGQPAACDIFAEFMSSIPRQHIRHVRDTIGAVLVSVSRNLPRAGRDAAAASASPTIAEVRDLPTDPYEHPELWPRTITDLPFQRYAIPIMRGLGRLDPENIETCLKGLIYTAIRSGSRQNRHEVRLFWLSVLARMPLARQDLLLQVMARFCGKRPGARKLSDVEISQLLALHWTSRGYLERPGDLLRDSSPDAQDTVLAQLACAICREMPWSLHGAFLTSLCRCLEQTGQLSSLVDSLEALCLQSSKLEARPFALLAVACGHYTSAMRLRRLVNIHTKKFGKGAKIFAQKWDWRFWATMVKELSKDASVSPLELRTLLGVDVRWQSRRKTGPFPKEDSMLGDLSVRTVFRLEESARDIVTHFATNAPPGRQLNRTALHLVTTRIRYLRAHGVTLTAPLLKALTRLLILDLVERQPGRTTRLRWLLGLIAENQGHETAEAVGRELTLWRKRNLRLAQGGPNKEDAAEVAIRLLDEAPDSEWDARLAGGSLENGGARETAIPFADGPYGSERA